MALLDLEMARTLVRLPWTEHHHVDPKHSTMDHRVDEAAFEALLVAGQNIATVRETLDLR
jgi:hypothetical protein